MAGLKEPERRSTGGSASSGLTWDPASNHGFARPELALVEALDWFGPAFSRWLTTLNSADSPTTFARLRVLRVLARVGPRRPTLVANELGVSQATLTGLVDGLVEDGLLRRRHDPADRRAVLLELTATGSRAAQDPTVFAAGAHLFDEMDAEEVLALLATVKTLSGRLRHPAVAISTSEERQS